MEERWKDVVGYEGLYTVSSRGVVKSFFWHGKPKERIIKQTLVSTGYYNVKLNKSKIRGTDDKKTFGVHRLLAVAFIENDDPVNKTEVNHKDHNGLNNTVENLEWVSHKYNILHSWKNPKRKSKNMVY